MQEGLERPQSPQSSGVQRLVWAPQKLQRGRRQVRPRILLEQEAHHQMCLMGWAHSQSQDARQLPQSPAG